MWDDCGDKREGFFTIWICVDSKCWDGLKVSLLISFENEIGIRIDFCCWIKTDSLVVGFGSSVEEDELVVRERVVIIDVVSVLMIGSMFGHVNSSKFMAFKYFPF